MSLANVYYPHAVRLPSPEITHLTDVSPDRGYQVMMESTAGSPVPCFVGVGQTDPSIPFSSRQLKSIIDTCTSEHLCRDLSAGTVDLWYRAGKPMAIRELDATAIHVVSRIATSAMLYWTNLRVSQGGIAEIDAQIVTAKRGVAETMVWLGEQTLPSVAGCQRIFGMGPVYLNDTLLEGVTGWTLATNPTLEPVASDGEKSNTYQGIRNYHPTVTLQSNNINEIIDSSLGGDAFGTLDLYLQRYVSTNIYDSAAATTHMRITITGGLRTVPGVTGQVATLAPVFYSIGPTPMLWDTASNLDPP